MTPRKVLMVCYYFPPIRTVGCTRSVAFARNLPACGWKPTVLTVRETRDPWVQTGAPVPEDVEVVRTREWSLARCADLADAVFTRARRLLGFRGRRSWIRELTCLPDSQVAWFSTVRGALLARSHDAIYVSCSPYSSALSGCFMKLLSGKPLVVDLRDAWTLNPHAVHANLHRAVIERLERLVFALADRIVLNTDGALRAYADLYPGAASKLVVVPNGYDELSPASEVARGERFSVMHFGSFYGSRQPDALLAAIRSTGLPIEFVQVGGGYARPAVDPGVPVTVIDTVERARALELMKSASLLYLRQGREPGVAHHMAVAAKTYEYLATGLPILADLPEGDNAEIVERYASNARLVKSGS
ncbi:MAG: glycosyltransferase, partial [Planctomycetota bacterium]